MAGTMKKVDKIRQIVRLKQLMTRWKQISLRRRSLRSEPEETTPTTTTEPCVTPRRQPPSGFVFVYVGSERHRFAIPARFLNFPVFAGLLDVTEEEFGLRGNGGLVLPCHVDFFTEIVKRLHKNENQYGKFSLEDFVKMFSDVAVDSYCKEKENVVVLAPLLQKASV
jgi:SAUR family protein